MSLGSTIPPQFRPHVIPGQVPDRQTMRDLEAFTAMPSGKRMKWAASERPYFSAAKVVDGLGMNKGQENDWRQHIAKAMKAPNELLMRQDLMSKMFEEGLDSGLRRELFARSMSLWRSSQVEKSVNVVTAGELSKAGPYIGPRGGKWKDAKHTIPWKEKKAKAVTAPLENKVPTKSMVAMFEKGKKARELYGRDLGSAAYDDDVWNSDFGVPGNEVHDLFWTAGFEDEPTPTWVRGWRYGDLPKSGYSWNSQESAPEAGVSLMGLEESGKLRNQGTGSLAALGVAHRPAFLVDGWLHHQTGGDGEPLFVGAKVVRKLTAKESNAGFMNKSAKKGAEKQLSKAGPHKYILRKSGPFIGPRGGKWKDAKHTIPWSEEKAKKPGKKTVMDAKTPAEFIEALGAWYKANPKQAKTQAWGPLGKPQMVNWDSWRKELRDPKAPGYTEAVGEAKRFMDLVRDRLSGKAAARAKKQAATEEVEAKYESQGVELEGPTKLSALRGKKVWLYHGTSSKLAGTIKTKGLAPAAEHGKRSNVGATASMSATPDFVYLTSETTGPGSAQWYARAASAKHGGNPVIMRVLVDGDDLSRDPDDVDLKSGGTQFVTDSVSSKQIKEIDGERLKKADPRGGTYIKRVPKEGGGWRYFYDEDKYNAHEGAHVSGEEAATTAITRAVAGHVKNAGDAGCELKTLHPLVKRYGAKLVGGMLNDACGSGAMRYVKGRLFPPEKKGNKKTTKSSVKNGVKKEAKKEHQKAESKPTEKNSRPLTARIAPSKGASEQKQGSTSKPAKVRKSLPRFFVPDEVLEKGGPYIGPKGGKWADVKHTIPWHEDIPREAIKEDAHSAVRETAIEAAHRAVASGANPKDIKYLGAGGEGILFVSSGKAYKVARRGSRDRGPQLKNEAEALQSLAGTPAAKLVPKVYSYDEKHDVIVRDMVEGRPGGWAAGKQAREAYDVIVAELAKKDWGHPEFKEDSFIFDADGKNPKMVDIGFVTPRGKREAKHVYDTIMGAKEKKDIDLLDVGFQLRASMSDGFTTPEVASKLRAKIAEVHGIEGTEVKGYLRELDNLIEESKLKKSAPHKYIKRTPKPGGGYRYYYRESAAAREATTGEVVRLGKRVATREYAKIAVANPEGQAAMFGSKTSPMDALKQASGIGGKEPQLRLVASMSVRREPRFELRGVL